MLKENNYPVSDWIKGFNRDTFKEIASSHPYFTDKDAFDTDISTMLTQAYKRIVRDYKNKKSQYDK